MTNYTYKHITGNVLYLFHSLGLISKSGFYVILDFVLHYMQPKIPIFRILLHHKIIQSSDIHLKLYISYANNAKYYLLKVTVELINKVNQFWNGIYFLNLVLQINIHYLHFTIFYNTYTNNSMNITIPLYGIYKLPK